MDATQTTEGLIKHLWYEPLQIHLPVKVQTREVNGGRAVEMGNNGSPRPLRSPDGQLVYALPGGMSFVDGRQ